MGSGIAHALLVAGCDVVLIEQNKSDLDNSHDRITASVTESVIRGALAANPIDTVARLTLSTSMSKLRSAELVIEAVPEEFSLKCAIFQMIETEVSHSAIIATNTSCLSVTELAASLKFPNRVIGLHFFNPVPSSQLVEIVITDSTDDILLNRARGWVLALAKTPIVVKDSPGFASTRLGVAIGLEAIRMLEQGVASAEDIDTAMELGYKHPVGPLRLTDLVGLDVRLQIARFLENSLGARFSPPELLIRMVANGELGRKSGKGFYDWAK